MSNENGDKPAMRDNSFDRFKVAMKSILSVSKPAVEAEEKRQHEARQAERAAKRLRRPA